MKNKKMEMKQSEGIRKINDRHRDLVNKVAKRLIKTNDENRAFWRDRLARMLKLERLNDQLLKKIEAGERET